MQMDSYYAFQQDDSPFFAAAGAHPASPELPFADLMASLLEEPPVVAAKPSAFQKYRDAGARGGAGGSSSSSGGRGNIHRRVMDTLGRIGSGGDQVRQEERQEEPPQQQQPAGAVESSRGFRHMMRERQRREKLSQSYADLYAMLSSRSRVRHYTTLRPPLRRG